MPSALQQAFKLSQAISMNILSPFRCQNLSCVMVELESQIGLCCEYISWTFGITGILDFVHHPEF
jgi:hypothetical protein